MIKEQIEARHKLKQMYSLDNKQVKVLSNNIVGVIDYTKLLEVVTDRLNTFNKIKNYLYYNQTSTIFELFNNKYNAYSFRNTINKIDTTKMIRKDIYNKCKEIEQYLISKNLLDKEVIEDIEIDIVFDDEDKEYLCRISWNNGFHTSYGKTEFEALSKAVEYIKRMEIE